MNIVEKIKNKNNDNFGSKPVTIAFLGDSVTHGCFDCYFDEHNSIQTYFKFDSSYTHRVSEMLHVMYPAAQINIINSGISGDNAYRGNKRFERDITPYSPDLVVVSYGLNDCGAGVENIKTYLDSLDSIFKKVKLIGAECIFLTENMMCTKVSCHLSGEKAIATAENLSKIQNSGTLDKYFEEAKKVAVNNNVKVCDIYSYWKKMYENGVDVTELLENKYNHPIEKMHYFTAMKLVEAIFE